MNKKFLQLSVGLSTAFLLVACSPSKSVDEGEESQAESMSSSHIETLIGSESDESGIAMNSGDEAAKDNEMDVPEDPFYETGETVIVAVDHAPGMEDAQAEVTGVYETTIYEVTYESTDDGAMVINYQWIVHEELENPEEIYGIGDEIVLTADHVPGMKGASATIDDAFYGQIYTVTYTDNQGNTVKNYQWLLADELRPADY